MYNIKILAINFQFCEHTANDSIYTITSIYCAKKARQLFFIEKTHTFKMKTQKSVQQTDTL